MIRKGKKEYVEVRDVQVLAGRKDTTITVAKVIGTKKHGLSLFRNWAGGADIWFGNLTLPRERKRMKVSPKEMRTLAKALLYTAMEAEMDAEHQARRMEKVQEERRAAAKKARAVISK